MKDNTKKVYCGKRYEDGNVLVTINNEPLDMQLDKVNHSPTGFNWGYGGSGVAQLAYAILYDYFRRNGRLTQQFYQKFKWDILSQIQTDEWSIIDTQIAEWLKKVSSTVVVDSKA